MNFEKNAVVYYNEEEARYVESDPVYEYANNEEFAKELSKRLDLNYGDMVTILKAFEDLVYDYLSITNWEQNVGIWVTKNICLKSSYDPEHLVTYNDDEVYKVVPEGFDFDIALSPELEKKCLDRLNNSRILREVTKRLEDERNKRNTEENIERT